MLFRSHGHVVVPPAVAAVLQSASAAAGILQALSITGAIAFSAALPLLMGIAIGASVPVLLSALGAGRDGKRTAFSYLVSNFLGVIIIAAVFYICDAVFSFPFIQTAVDPFSIALINTLFRLAIVLLLAPFTGAIEAVGTLLVRDKKKEAGRELVLEERFLDYPALAVEQSKNAVCQMAEDSMKAVNEAVKLLNDFNYEGMRRVKELEDEGDHYEDALGEYIMKLTSRELTSMQSSMASVYLHTLSDFERISDHAMNIAESAQEISDKNISFSEDESADIAVISDAVEKILELTIHSFIQDDLREAQKVEPLEEVIDGLTDQIKIRHVDRLRIGKSTIGQGFVVNDLITDFERISDHCSNIAVALVELHTGDFDSHNYLDVVRKKHNSEFEKNYEQFLSQYSLKE